MKKRAGAGISVPILRIPFTAEDRRFLTKNLNQILDRSALAMGDFTREFETTFAKLCNVPHAVATSSGTAALELMLSALQIRGGTVIVPTNTFGATALAVARTGSRVLFADSCTDDFCLDPEDVKRRWRKDTAAVLTVHIGGLMSGRLGELRNLCEERGVPLLEDCAHAHGCSWNGVPAGAVGKAGAFSFFPTKPMTCGEGGMVTTTDAELADRMRILRNQGKDPHQGNHIGELGTHWRMSEITALFGVLATRKAPETISGRQKTAVYYERALRDTPGISVVKPVDGVSSSYYKFILWLDEGIDRTELKKLMKNLYGVSLTGEVYADLCHAEPVWQKHPEVVAPIGGPFSGAEEICRRHVCLPVHPDMTLQEMRHVIDSLKKTLREILPGAGKTAGRKRIPVSA